MRAIALLLTVLTGFSGLVYQVAWQKYLAALLGSHSEATAAVLGIFLGGLSYGYLLFGRVSRRLVETAPAGQGRARVVYAYGLVEAAIGVYALLFPAAFSLGRSLSLALPTGAGELAFALDVAITALLIGPPTILMGGTIPLLTQGLSVGLGDATRFHSWVYAFNTTGAFAGALCAGFLLIPAWGLSGSVTAMGVVNNDAKVKIGESVVVFGVGGVGLNLVQCAHMVAAHPIVAVDLHDNKLEIARRFGATHVINSTKVDDLDAEIRSIVGRNGADNILESTGVKSVIELAYELAHPDGVCVLVGVPSEKVSINTLPIHFNKVLTGSHGGNSVPDVDIPRIVQLNRAGKMTFDGMITHEFAPDEINTAIDLVKSGTAGRVLLRMDRD